MDLINTNSLKPDSSFTGSLMIDKNFIFLPADATLTQSMIDALSRWGFSNIICEGELNLENAIEKNSSSSAAEKDSQSAKEQTPAEIFRESVKKSFGELNNGLENTDRARMQMVNTYYTEFMNFISMVFTHYATHGEINKKELAETVQNLCIFIKENRRYILRLNPAYEENAKSYLINHTMRTTVIAIAIALQLRMPLSQMIDLGVACILHEIGMLSLPPQLYMTRRRLTPGERTKIKTHSIEGLKIVQNLEFSAPIQMGVLQHHEKENGTGYPQRLTGEKITNIAKIISVACSYEAISSPRNYKAERTSFEAMLEMLKNDNHPYDDNIIKALLYAFSLFPIGAYVYLKSEKIGIVVDVNPNNPKLPLVQLLLEKDKDGSPLTVQSDNGAYQIVRVLTIKEQQDVMKAVSEAENKIKESNGSQATNHDEVSSGSLEPDEMKNENFEETASVKKKGEGLEDVDMSFFD